MRVYIRFQGTLQVEIDEAAPISVEAQIEAAHKSLRETVVPLGGFAHEKAFLNEWTGEGWHRNPDTKLWEKTR